MKVSVCMITYNHEKYINQAIEGILNQKTNFEYELIIGEDFSTDKTRQIISQYKDKYPNQIKLLNNNENIGMMPNFISSLEACTGEYIAICEGDDYWIDDLKLQKQVDLLEVEPNASLCFHPVHVINENEDITSTTSVFEFKKEYTTIDLLAQDWFVMTCSIMVRRKSLVIPDWFVKVKNGDYALQLLCSLSGILIYINSVMGVYRIHPLGMSQNLQYGKNFHALSFLLNQFNIFSNYQFNTYINKRIERMKNSLIHYYLFEAKKHKYFSSEYLKYFKHFTEFTEFSNIYHLKLTANLLVPPRLYKFYKTIRSN